MARRLAVLAALLVVLARPGIAWADTDILGGFTSGVSDFVSPKEEQVIVTPEKDFNESYEPVLYEENQNSVRALPEDATTIDYVNNTIDSFNRVQWGQSQTLLGSIRVLFISVNNAIGWITASIALVFMWWGVRKTIRMLMSAWRKGHETI